ncbi:MAG TPA: VWA domain-containing protein [Pyrinomonadaceae bacterium]|nr:VWA domain-containing protein [Pyrinomonadaceae bacterium]
MKRHVASLLLFVLSLASPLSLLAQTPSGQQSDEGKLVVGANEVLLDAVVRDKKGRPVKDLKVSDFQIMEDGVPQEVKSFRLVAGGAEDSAAAGADSAAKAGGPPKTQSAETSDPAGLGAVALVFDKLSVDSRNRARAAALSYLGGGLGANDFVGVFSIGLSLSVLQNYTNDERLVRQAVDSAGAVNSPAFASNTAKVTELSERDLELRSKVDAAASEARAAAAGGAAPTSSMSVGLIDMERRLNAMKLRAEQGFEWLEQTQQGFATTNGLLAIISSMSQLPGRKALVLFSEGALIPASVAANFRTVISNANRANVSIYTVDAAGLRATSANMEAGRAMTVLGQQRSNPDDMAGPMTKDLERNEELVRHNPESGLGQLASETGGLLIASTNNPGERLRQVNEDLHSYYALTYSPKNQNYDGRFRQISVKVNRPGVEVQARKGYYALGATYDSPVLAYEVPALAALNGKPQSGAFNVKAAAFSFPEVSWPGLVPVMVEVPAGAVNFVADAAKKTYKTDFAVVVLFRDETQRVVKKLSNHYVLGGPLAELENAKRGDVLFYSQADLEPGRYTVDSIVYDATNNQFGVNKGAVVVPSADQSRLRVSSVVFVGKAQKLSANEQQMSNPFRAGELLLYPNFGEALSKASSKGLSLFVTIYAPQGSAPKMRLEFAQAGRALGGVPVELPAPDQTGRIQYTGIIPLDVFPPGDYELKAVVTDGAATATSSGRFTIKQ